MPVTRRRSKEKTGEEMKSQVIFVSKEEEESPPPTEMEVHLKKLRQSWELASVLNFINVFEPVIESNLKITAEEIEMALIEPNDLLTRLHIALLKGVVPPKKSLDDSDAWVSILSKKLAMWWPWVAEGDFPLTAAKGEEMNTYMQLDPKIRLSILKALCEIRADQHDIVSYINDAVKNGNGLSTFRKEKLGDDGNGTVYWYEGSATIGHRLYKEVCTFERRPKVKNMEVKGALNSRWETLATNLEEFQKLANEFSSSELQLEVSVGKAVEANAIPALKKLQRKKDRLLKLQNKQDMLLNGFRAASIITRSGRNCRPVSYRFEDYDRAINEAIEVTQKRKTAEELGHEEKIKKQKKGQNVSIEDSDNIRDSGFNESDNDSEKHQGGNSPSRNDAIEEITDGNNKCLKNLDQENDNTDHGNDLILHFQKLDGWMVHGSKGSCCSPKLARSTKETSATTKQILGQIPAINAVVPDSEDQNCSNDIDEQTGIYRNST